MAGIVLVRFLASYAVYNAGELAGFSAAEAEALFARGVAERVSGRAVRSAVTYETAMIEAPPATMAARRKRRER